jgi:hypothetical protein
MTAHSRDQRDWHAISSSIYLGQYRSRVDCRWHDCFMTASGSFFPEAVMARSLRALAAVLLLSATASLASGCALLSFGAGAATGAAVEDEVDDDEDD